MAVRLCFANTNPAWGGGEKWTLDHARWLAERGHEVCLLAQAGGPLAERAREAGLAVLELKVGGLSFLNPMALLRVAHWLRRRRVQALVASLPQDYKLAGLAGRLAGVGRIIFRRGLARPVADTVLNRFLYRRVADGVIANSQETRRTILATNSRLLPQERLVVIPNGFDLAAFDQQQGQPLHVKAAGEFVVGNAARLEPQKGQAEAIELVARLRGQELQVSLLLAGEGRLRQELEAQARRLGVADHVRLLGFVGRMADFYASLDAFVLTSRFEGFCYALVEAMAAGVPVVAYAASNIPELVTHEVNGLLVPPGDVGALAAAVERLAREPALRGRLAAAGRRLVEQQLDRQRILTQVEEVLVGSNPLV